MAVAVTVGAAMVGGHQVAAIDDDVPKRQPTLIWEVPVECDTDAELAASTDGRHCAMEFSRDAVYVHEHSATVGSGGPFRLSAIDVSSGVQRWSHEVGETFELRLTDEAVVLSDKAHIEVYDADDGSLRFRRDGELVHLNTYGVLIMDEADGSITAVDATGGDELWSRPGQVGAMCRDFVALVPAASEPAAPFTLVEHRSGDERWTSDRRFDSATDHMACSGAPWIYVSDGEQIYELDSIDGWTTWETPIADAGVIDLYREVALVRSGAEADTVVAVKREDGTVLWDTPAGQIGASLSWIGRLRQDSAGIFTLNPLTGETVTRVDFDDDDFDGGDTGADGAAFDVVGVSDTRVVVAVGSVVTTFGMNDLGTAWQLDVGGDPDDFGVARGVLVVRSGSNLRGYAVAPRAAE